MALAQTCPPGSTLRKNDILPDIPMGPLPVAIVSGLCDGEAAMSVFTVPGPVRVHTMTILYANRFGTNGVTAAVDAEVYDGASVNAQGRWTLGPMVYRLSNGGSNMQVTSTGFNTLTLSSPVRCTSGKVVIGFRMILNGAGGSCLFGYDSNFACDNQFVCTPGINVLDAIGHGPVDPATYTGFGTPLCPTYFRGSWGIRACMSVEANANTLTLTPSTLPPNTGATCAIAFTAPGRGGDTYLLMPTFTTTPGIPVPPPGMGTIPINPSDPLFFLALTGALDTIIINRVGILNSSGQGFGLFIRPAGIPPIQFYFVGVAAGAGGITAYSDPALLTLQ